MPLFVSPSGEKITAVCDENPSGHRWTQTINNVIQEHYQCSQCWKTVIIRDLIEGIDVSRGRFATVSEASADHSRILNELLPNVLQHDSEMAEVLSDEAYEALQVLINALLEEA